MKLGKNLLFHTTRGFLTTIGLNTVSIAENEEWDGYLVANEQHPPHMANMHQEWSHKADDSFNKVFKNANDV